MNVPVPATVPAPTPAPVAVKPPSTLLLGPPGTGKTDSVATLVEAGLELFFIGVEPNALDTLLDSLQRRKLPLDRVHWRYIPPANPDLDSITSMATRIGSSSYEELAGIKQGIAKDKTQQFLEMLKTFKNFKDERTGADFGSIFAFGDDKALVIDSMTGLNDMAMLQTVGYKPAPALGEWGVAMKLELDTIKLLCSSLNCFFVLTAHADKEVNELTGAKDITSSALGVKNAAKIMRPFSEIVLTKRGKDIKDFRWSTWEGPTVDLKSRALPISDSLEPSFVQLVAAHKRRKAQTQEVTSGQT